MISRIIQTEVNVICRSWRLRWITLTEVWIILDFMRKPNPIIVLLYTQNSRTKGAVTRGNFFLQLATQRRFKLPFTREIVSCNTSSLQNNPTAGHTTTCICLQLYRNLHCLFHPNLRSKLQEKIASCDSALRYKQSVAVKRLMRLILQNFVIFASSAAINFFLGTSVQ